MAAKNVSTEQERERNNPYCSRVNSPRNQPFCRRCHCQNCTGHLAPLRIPTVHCEYQHPCSLHSSTWSDVVFTARPTHSHTMTSRYYTFEKGSRWNTCSHCYTHKQACSRVTLFFNLLEGHVVYVTSSCATMESCNRSLSHHCPNVHCISDLISAQNQIHSVIHLQKRGPIWGTPLGQTSTCTTSLCCTRLWSNTRCGTGLFLWCWIKKMKRQRTPGRKISFNTMLVLETCPGCVHWILVYINITGSRGGVHTQTEIHRNNSDTTFLK